MRGLEAGTRPSEGQGSGTEMKRAKIQRKARRRQPERPKESSSNRRRDFLSPQIGTNQHESLFASTDLTDRHESFLGSTNLTYLRGKKPESVSMSMSVSVSES